MTETLSPPATRRLADVLLDLIVIMLAPMFLSVCGGDVSFARAAARQTINEYRANNGTDLLSIAQIVAFGLVTLSSLSLSMEDGISLSMTLRLRASATGLDRAAERNRRALRDSLAACPAAAPEIPQPDAAVEAELFLSAAAAQELAEEAQARLFSPSAGQKPNTAERQQAMWAIAMVKEASDISAGLASLPAADRQTASIRIEALSNTANQLLTGAAVQPLQPGALDAMMRNRQPASAASTATGASAG